MSAIRHFYRAQSCYFSSISTNYYYNITLDVIDHLRNMNWIA